MGEMNDLRILEELDENILVLANLEMIACEACLIMCHLC